VNRNTTAKSVSTNGTHPKLSAQNISFGVHHPANGIHTPHVRTPFGYFGSKQRLATRIASALPPHNAWVEAFCGSAAVTLAKMPAPIEIINDLDRQIINFFQQLREHPVELCHAIELTPYAREEYETSKVLNEGPDKLEQARRFLVASMMTVNGAFGSNQSGKSLSGFSYSQSYARNGVEARVNRWNSLPARLEKVVQRLKAVRVENRNALTLLKMFLDRPATLMYLDPPYLMDRDHGYKMDANEESFHKELLSLSCQAQCMVLISGYDNDLYSSTLSQKQGWERTTMETHTRDTKGKDYSRTEVLWMNRVYVRAERGACLPIKLTEEEKNQNKVNPARSVVRKRRQ
jgi:DNA adenine methylase